MQRLFRKSKMVSIFDFWLKENVHCCLDYHQLKKTLTKLSMGISTGITFLDELTSGIQSYLVIRDLNLITSLVKLNPKISYQFILLPMTTVLADARVQFECSNLNIIFDTCRRTFNQSPQISTKVCFWCENSECEQSLVSDDEACYSFSSIIFTTTLSQISDRCAHRNQICFLSNMFTETPSNIKQSSKERLL